MLGYDPDLSSADLEAMGIPADRLVDGHLGNLVSPLLRMRPFPGKTLAEVIKKPFGENGVHLIPSDGYLDDLGVALDAANNSDFWYAQWIEAGNTGGLPDCDLSVYDVIIFDNAPAASRLTKNSVAAGDLLLCPVRMDKFSFRALMRLHDWVVRFAQDYKRSPAIAALPTMFIKNRKRLLGNLLILNELFPNRVTDEKLYFSEDYGKALDQGIPMLLWKGTTAKTFESARTVFGEVLERMRVMA